MNNPQSEVGHIDNNREIKSDNDVETEDDDTAWYHSSDSRTTKIEHKTGNDNKLNFH